MIQLMLPFDGQVQEAIHKPQEANLLHLLKAFDVAVAQAESEGLDNQSLLKVAGEAISKIADVFEAKYGTVLEEIRASGASDGPVMAIDAFDRYVRSSMQIDFAQYIEPIPMLNLPSSSNDFYSGWNGSSAYREVEASVVSEVSQSILEDWMELLEHLPDLSEKQKLTEIHDLSHGEEIEVWSQELRSLIEQLRKRKKKNLPFLDLVYALKRQKDQTLKESSSELWLTFLLGDHPYQLRRTAHDFYSAIGIEVVNNDFLDWVLQEA